MHSVKRLSKSYQGKAMSCWRVELGSGRVYKATTYPDSKLVFLETDRGRSISPIQARSLLPVIKQAIEAAQ